ncbi:hypothetical protein GW17_00018364 [Ensete ventricosum]|nr:hypothetical protein GW17_00018364 [Ensete ventricosum]
MALRRNIPHGSYPAFSQPPSPSGRRSCRVPLLRLRRDRVLSFQGYRCHQPLALRSDAVLHLCHHRRWVVHRAERSVAFAYPCFLKAEGDLAPAIPVTVLTLGFHVITPFVCKIVEHLVLDDRQAILMGGRCSISDSALLECSCSGAFWHH